MVLLSGTDYTIETAIKAAAAAFDDNDLFFGHGTDTAMDEASWLILHSLNLSPLVAPDYSRPLTRKECESCNANLTRRITERIPVAYITGETWFAGHRFLTDERALVPRSPLAEFIRDGFFGLLDHVEKPAILDLCTGGGCIAIACAHELPSARVHASDLSPEALELAAKNVELHALQQRIHLYQGSLFEPITEKYSLIISNPPYVDAQDINSMPSEFGHEPAMGLAAGEDGLDLVRIMLREAAQYLHEEGHLVVEVGNSGEALEAEYPNMPFGWLQFAHGGHGVFVLSHSDLMAANTAL
ncbi:MAG: 50S ribosomal protein L3 N(5)-glutamine methyltransferase [Granulosicoccus sp.]